MALYENFNLEDFPYTGAFYTYEVDEDAPLDERVPKETLIFETVCDIQRRGKFGGQGMLAADYVVFFPLEENPDATGTVDKYGPILVRRGMKFRGECYGYTAEGVVEFVRVSQLGGCSCDIKITTESDI